MTGHGHGHSCADDHHDHDHDHDHDHGPPADPNAAPGTEDVWLYPFIDLDSVRALNDAEPERVARNALRAHEQRHDAEAPFCESEADEQLLVHVPFNVSVKVKSICVIGGGSDARQWPAHLKVFLNRDDVDFNNADAVACTQEWALAPEQGGERAAARDDLLYATKYARFQNVHALTLFFSANFGGDTTRIQYIGFKGVATGYRRQVVEAVYEARPLAADSRSKVEQGAARHVV